MTRERIFLDTWFILALLNARDEDHAEAKRLLPRIRSAAALVTTDAILLEACNGLAKYNRTGAAHFARTCYTDPSSTSSRSIAGSSTPRFASMRESPTRIGD